jgi:hypothetical protein
MTQAQDLSGVVLHPDPRNSMGSPPKRTDSLRALSMNFEKLAHAVDGADADPSADALTSYASLTQTLDATLAAWHRLSKEQLPALNSQLKAAGQASIAL